MGVLKGMTAQHDDDGPVDDGVSGRFGGSAAVLQWTFLTVCGGRLGKVVFLFDNNKWVGGGEYNLILISIDILANFVLYTWQDNIRCI